jgi:hypothetical protein
MYIKIETLKKMIEKAEIEQRRERWSVPVVRIKENGDCFLVSASSDAWDNFLMNLKDSEQQYQQ